MARLVALLRAVNVGGTGKLAMADLRARAEGAGFTGVRTVIQSGNLVFETGGTDAEAEAALQAALPGIGVFLRRPADLRAALEAAPFPGADPRRVGVLFLDGAPGPALLEPVRGRTDEEIVPGLREVYLHFPSGMGPSRLRLPAMDRGTMRNLASLARILAVAEADPAP